MNANELRAIARNFYPSEIADKSGLHIDSIYGFLRGVRKPTRQSFIKIQEACLILARERKQAQQKISRELAN